jgi:hypothetical protein
MPGLLLVVAASICPLAAHVAAASDRGGTLGLTSGAITLTLDTASFAFHIQVDGELWFNSSTYAFSSGKKTHSHGGKGGAGLTPVGKPVSAAGYDAAGAFDSIALSWSGSGGAEPEWITTFKAYTTGRSALAFQQSWPRAVAGTDGGSIFPSLQAASSTHRLGTLEYTGSSCGFMVSAKGSWPGITGGKSKGYIVIAPHDGAGTGSSATATIGPVTEHFANQARNGGSSLDYGLAPSFTFVPAHYTLETVLTVSSRRTLSTAAAANPERATVPPGGVNAALFEYGDYVLARHSKARALGNHTVEMEYLGYSTTAFYFYNLCDCLEKPAANARNNFSAPDPHNRQTCSKGQSPIPSRYLQRAATPGVCASYADTLIAVNAALEEQGIPIKHFLLDSWWYGEGWNGGASLWEDVPQCTGNDTSLSPSAWPADTFPQGLRHFHQQVGTDKSIWVHNGKWNPASPYRKKYPFIPNGAPQGPELWEHLFSANKEWGLSTIKQDHIGEQMGGTKGAFTNVSVLKSWLSGMGEGASKNGVGVLYCCAPPNIHMNGVTVPAAYAVRASPDYVWGAGGHAIKLPTVQWAIGPDNAFHWSGLGLLPYKDTFISNSSSTQKSGEWSTDEKMWPSFYGYHERNAPTHALMSLLSMASVTFGDAVGESNKTLLMRLCRSDGMLLKADRPATAMDAQFQAMMFGSWPGRALPPPSPPHHRPHPPPTGPPRASVTLAKCVAGDPMQTFSGGTPTSAALRLAGPHNDQGCLDVGGCQKSAGSQIHLYNNTLGPCGSVSVCQGQNEQWIVADGLIKSVLSTNMCLKVAPDGGEATLARCDPRDSSQALIPKRSSNGEETFAIVSKNDPAQCLTAFQPVPTSIIVAPMRGAFSWDDDLQEESVTRELFPAESGLSPGYRHAYATSTKLMEQLETARHSAEQRQRAAAQHGETCEAGFGAPQGPLGEVYSTHTTVSGLTWRYVVGVQLSSDYNISASDLAIGPGSPGARQAAATTAAAAAAQHVSYVFSEAHTFKPTTAAELAPFGGSADAKLLLRQSDGEMCETAPRFKITTRCFPYQVGPTAMPAALGGQWLIVCCRSGSRSPRSRATAGH